MVAGKPLYLAFIDLEKAFDRVPREVIWWSMRKLKIDEWLVRIVQSMYKEVRSKVRVGDEYSNSFDIRVGVHQGSVLSPLLFVIVLEALSMELRTGVGRNAIQCGGCRQWVHKKCSGIKGSLTSDLKFRCARCLGTAWLVDGRLVKEVMIGDEKLEVLPEFCYLGDFVGYLIRNDSVKGCLGTLKL